MARSAPAAIWRLSATQSVTAVGQNLSAGEQTVTGRTVDLSASQTQARRLTLSATAGDLTLTGANISASGTATFGAAQTLRTDTATVIADTLKLSAQELSNRQGALYSTTALNATLSKALDNRQGRLSSSGALTVQDAQASNKALTLAQHRRQPARRDLGRRRCRQPQRGRHAGLERRSQHQTDPGLYPHRHLLGPAQRLSRDGGQSD